MSKADHWEHLIIPRIGALFDAFHRGFPVGSEIPRAPGLIFGTDRKKHKALSPNQWAMGVNGELLRASAYGTAAEYDSAKKVTLFYLELELVQLGLWQSEQFSGIPHGGMHMNAMFAGRVAALHRKDSELLTIQGEQFRRLFTYLAAASTPNGEIVCCGERMPQGPAAYQQSAVWREAHRLPHPDAKKIENHLTEDTWVSLRGIRALLTAGDKMGGALEITPEGVESLPLTAKRVEIRRWPEGHAAQYLEPVRPGAVAWAEVSYRSGKVEWGATPRVAPRQADSRILTTVRRSRT